MQVGNQERIYPHDKAKSTITIPQNTIAKVFLLEKDEIMFGQKRQGKKPGTVLHICNRNTWEAEAGTES